ncbi:sel1 repeat family protein [Litorivicinus sp.]|nr:sel1 repeat family protein [Litorivicinus sp.]
MSSKQIFIGIIFLCTLGSANARNQDTAVVKPEYIEGVVAMVEGDYSTAITKFTPLAESGNHLAQYRLFLLYVNGWGAQKNLEVAAKWVKLSAEQGNADAQLALGRLYDKGMGVSADQQLSNYWIEQSADGGNAEAQYIFALDLLAKDMQSKSNVDNALIWLKSSADQGYVSAQSLLGLMYLQLGSHDPGEAIKWLKLASAEGDLEAQYNLGVAFAVGKGVLQDNRYAHMWLNIAGASGYEKARVDLQKLQQQMTPEDISGAQELARECIRKKLKGCS